MSQLYLNYLRYMGTHLKNTSIKGDDCYAQPPISSHLVAHRVASRENNAPARKCAGTAYISRPVRGLTEDNVGVYHIS